MDMGEKLSKKIWNSGAKFRQNRNVDSIVILEIEEAEVLKILHSLK